jgi:hypothetical protein
MMLIAIMPHTMTRPEVAKRLGIEAMADATPGISYRELARYFGTSFSVVRDALWHPVAHWASLLAVAPAPPSKVRVKPVVQPIAVISSRPGSRERARLEEPDPIITIPEPVHFDEPEPVINDQFIEDAYADADDEQDRVLRGVEGRDRDGGTTPRRRAGARYEGEGSQKTS